MMTPPAMPVMEGNETILLVEDDSAVRVLLASGLEKFGYSVLSACNGEDALSAADLHDGPINLVISDIVMPEMNGLQLFARLRDWYPALRYLLISGYTKALVVEGEFEDERTGFLAKPFTVGQLVRASRALLDERRPRTTQPRLRAMEFSD